MYSNKSWFVHLVWSLVGKVDGIFVAATEEQHTGTILKVVDGTDMKRCVTRGILTIHISTVEQ